LRGRQYVCTSIRIDPGVGKSVAGIVAQESVNRKR
tara:strand:- start:2323 stop:2427 length:105 start_codon:yes stop_codon:yes gene_type:complete